MNDISPPIVEIVHLVIQCLYNWVHGFGLKTGAEPWFKKQSKRENKRFPKGSQRRDY